MKFPRILISALTAGAMLAAQSAHAQALPAPVYTIPDAAALARAAAVWGAASLVVNSGLGGATVATAAGGALGLTPVAGLAAGVAVLGVSMYVSVRGLDGTKRDLLVLIGPALSLINPDYGLVPYAKVYNAWTWPSYPYINTTNNPATDTALHNKIIDQMIATGSFYALDPTTFELPSQDSNTPSTSVRIYFRFKAALPSSQNNMQWFGSYIDKGVEARVCPDGYSYSLETTSCVLLNSSIETDQTCRVSYDVTGAPIFNSKDPDCALAKSAGGFTIAPPTSTTPAIVNLTEPDTGRTLKTELYTQSTQGQAPGTFKTTERVPDLKNSIVRESSTLMTPVAGSTSPIVQSSVQRTYDGTNTNVTPTSVPLDRISISNWPTSLDNLGPTMSQLSSHAGTIANNTVQMSNQLQQMNAKLDKLGDGGVSFDTTVPADAQAPPTAPADLAARDHKTFLQPLKDKLAGFASFEFPAHASSCPAIAFDVTAWGVRYDVNSNYMCSWLEEHQALVSGLAYFSYLVTAILIVLGA